MHTDNFANNADQIQRPRELIFSPSYKQSVKLSLINLLKIAIWNATTYQSIVHVNTQLLEESILPTGKDFHAPILQGVGHKPVAD